MSQYLLKAHVRDYDRVSKTGAVEHIRAHEDSRVRSYARKIVGSENSYALHQLRRDRFGHLPHWSKLDEHTRQAILDAEEEKAKGHKEGCREGRPVRVGAAAHVQGEAKRSLAAAEK